MVEEVSRGDQGFPICWVDFRGSVDLVLPEGIHWDASGTKDHNLVTIFFLFFIFFWLYDEGSKSFCFHHADRGASCPTGIHREGNRWSQYPHQYGEDHKLIS
jgi:hypothetical protein